MADAQPRNRREKISAGIERGLPERPSEVLSMYCASQNYFDITLVNLTQPTAVYTDKKSLEGNRPLSFLYYLRQV